MAHPQVLAGAPHHGAPLIVRQGEGEVIEIFGGARRFLLTGEETGGRLLLGQGVGEAGSGPPLHVHEQEDELFIVLSGCCEMVLGSECFEAGPGTVAWGPRGLPHTFRIISDEPAEMMGACLPAGFERFSRLLAQEFATGAPNRNRIAREGDSFGFAFLSPEDAAGHTARAAQQGARARVVRPSEGRCWEAHGHRARIILAAEDTNGALGLVELQTPPGSGPTLHAHSHEDEIFLVQQGLYEFHIAGKRVEVGPGGVVYAPRPHAHSFRVLGPEAGRMLVLFQPGGFEEYFARAGQVLEDGPLDSAKLAAIGAELGLVCP